MQDHLYAWADDGSPIGRFDRNGTTIRFEYARYQPVPISLSLPLTGRWGDTAPRAFLDGLLPDTRAGRLRMATALGADASDVFSLLDSVDSAGGLVFTRSESQPERVENPLTPVTYDDLADAVGRAHDRTGTPPWDDVPNGRFSLAGSQEKFTLTVLGGRAFWPSASLPSTHILKPDGVRVADVARVEEATMSIAGACGIDVPDTQVLEISGIDTYVIERFDRRVDGGDIVHRLRTEDLCQALGRPSEEKYDVEMGDVVGVMRESGLPDHEIYSWVGQVAFNDLIGNSDAHAKNYSLYLEPGRMGVCPLYDSISMAHWEEFRNGTLAMPVNGVYDPWEVTLADWRAEASSVGLDPDAVEEIVTTTQTAIEGCRERIDGIDAGIRDEILDYSAICARDLFLTEGSDRTALGDVESKPADHSDWSEGHGHAHRSLS